MKILLSIMLLSCSLLVNAQMPSPVHWKVELHNDKDGQWINLDATMDDEWVVYSQHMTDEGPVPTTFDYNLNGKTALDGKTEELSEVIVKYSKLFEMDVKKFKHEAKFKQKIKLDGSGMVSVDVTFMTCSGDKCLPPTTETFTLKY